MFDPTEGHEFAIEGTYYYDKSNLRKARVERVDEGRNTTHRYVHVIELFAEVRDSVANRLTESYVEVLFRLGFQTLNCAWL